ncbi:MAG: helix-turn-helix domain-containing protein [Pseudonocardiaceae bacterium]
MRAARNVRTVLCTVAERGDNPPQRRAAPVSPPAVRDVIRPRLRQIRNSRKKSLRVVAELTKISKSTRSCIEHGEIALNSRAEIVALANVLQIVPSDAARVISRAAACTCHLRSAPALERQGCRKAAVRSPRQVAAPLAG